MDNRLLDINGPLDDRRPEEGERLLLMALEIAFRQDSFGENPRTCKSYNITPKGLVLSWWGNDQSWQACPGNLSAKDCLPFALAYLRSDKAKDCELAQWERNADHDGHNSHGWRVYVEKWGHVGDCSTALCAVKPCFMWHGK